jgi:hypothetical protein
VQAKDNNASNNTSSWVAYGSNNDTPLPADTDFEVSVTPPVNNSPTLSALAQLENLTPIVQGGKTSSTTVVFEAVVTEVDTGQTVKLQVEVAMVNQAFPATFDASDPMSAESSLVSAPAGSLLSVPVTPFADGTYYWRARAIDDQGLASAWTSFGTNSDNNPPTIAADIDFTVDTSGGINPDPGGGGGGGGSGSGCGGSIADAPLPWGLLALLSLVLFFPGRRRI